MPLVRVIQQLSFARDLGTVQDIVRRAARSLTNADGATFVLRDRGMCYYADEDAIAPLWKGRRFPMETCISGWVMLNRRAVAIDDVTADSRIPAEVYRPTFVRSLAMVPIRSLDPIGAIGAYWATAHAATEDEVRVLQALADTTAVAMENVRIYTELEERVRERTQELEAATEAVRSLSLRDELTGLYNRRGFNLMAEQSRRAARRVGADQFVLYLDADGLKQVNDTRGHPAGDALLRSLAYVLKRTFREADVIARMGGDEFCVMGTACAGGAALSERLDSALARFNAESAPTAGSQLRASCGIAPWPANAETSLDEVVRAADEAMYFAKRTRGRHPSAARSSSQSRVPSP